MTYLIKFIAFNYFFFCADNFNIQPLERDAYSFSMSSKQRTVTAFNDASSHNKSTPMPYSRELTMS